MPWTTTYLFFLLIIIINKLLYEASLCKPIFSFILISLLFATNFFLLTYGENIEIIEHYTSYRDVSIGQAWISQLGFWFSPNWGFAICFIVRLNYAFHKRLCFRIFVSMMSCVLIVLLIIMLLTWPSFYSTIFHGNPSNWVVLAVFKRDK